MLLFEFNSNDVIKYNIEYQNYENYTETKLVIEGGRLLYLEENIFFKNEKFYDFCDVLDAYYGLKFIVLCSNYLYINENQYPLSEQYEKISIQKEIILISNSHHSLII